MRGWLLPIGIGFLLSTLFIWWGFKLDSKEFESAKSWCEPRGYQTFTIKGRKFCVDPKTRLVYYPPVS